MRIDHVALWTRDLEGGAAFWADHFGAALETLYVSRNRPGFRSIFASLPDGPRLELMTGPWVVPAALDEEPEDWAHGAVSVGSEQAVREKAAQLEAFGLLVSRPRITGDGYFEAVARALDGTLVEIMQGGESR